jgi:hypothetical protein
MANKQDRTGRSKGAERFVALPHYILECPAWLSLTAPARVVYLELMRLYNGSNNGSLALSVRDASDRCNVAKDTASRAFLELSEKGFIECMRLGGFSRKTRLATEWRVTALKCDRSGRLSTKPFMTWGRNKWASGSKPLSQSADTAVPNDYRECPKSGTLLSQKTDTEAASVPILGPWSPEIVPQLSQTAVHI